MTQSSPNKNKKVANGLVALSSAAVLAVYAAGYTRTRAAADLLEARAAERRPMVPAASALPGPIESPASAPTAAQVPAAASVSKPAEMPAPAQSSPSAPVADPVADPVAPPADEHKAEVAVVAPAAALPAAPPEFAPAPVVPAPPAPAPATPAAPPAASAPAWKDGTYYGWGSSRHGDIQAAVVIEGGRIFSASISQCLTRYSCSVIARLPPQVAQRQSPEVDYVSGATQSANAFYYAVVDALGKAK